MIIGLICSFVFFLVSSLLQFDDDWRQKEKQKLWQRAELALDFAEKEAADFLQRESSIDLELMPSKFLEGFKLSYFSLQNLKNGKSLSSYTASHFDVSLPRWHDLMIPLYIENLEKQLEEELADQLRLREKALSELEQVFFRYDRKSAIRQRELQKQLRDLRFSINQSIKKANLPLPPLPLLMPFQGKADWGWMFCKVVVFLDHNSQIKAKAVLNLVPMPVSETVARALYRERPLWFISAGLFLLFLIFLLICCFWKGLGHQIKK